MITALVDCVFDEHKAFRLSGLSPEEAEAITATITVYNANTVLRNTVIGRFSFSARDVYNLPAAAGQPAGVYNEVRLRQRDRPA